MQTEAIKHLARTIAIAMPDQSAELAACYEQLAKQEAVLIACREHFEENADVIDGSYGEPAPNREMTLLIEIDQVLA